jgi:hypothetical protein
MLIQYGAEYKSWTTNHQSKVALSDAESSSDCITPILPYAFVPGSRASSREVDLLFRNRLAEPFLPSELPIIKSPTTSMANLPLNWKEMSEEAMEEALGIPNRNKTLISLPVTGVQLIRTSEKTGFYTRLLIRNISQYLLTYRVKLQLLYWMVNIT